MAKFLGVEDAICFSMGFATNSLNTPCLADEVSISEKLIFIKFCVADAHCCHGVVFGGAFFDLVNEILRKNR